MRGKRVKSKWIKEGLADGKASKNYNDGQKSRDTCISGAFSSSHRPNPPLTPQTMLDLNFFRVSTLYIVWGSGEGELNKSFEKDDCFKNERTKK